MERIDLYRKIHKAQRAWLGRVLAAAGRLDAGDPAATAAIRTDAGRLVAHLRSHAEHEERFIHPLLGEIAPTVTAALDAEHHVLEAQLGGVVAAGNAAQLYDALGGLAAAYFAHLEVEERQAMPALWAAYDDAAFLERIVRPFVASRTAGELLADLRLQLAAVNPVEAAQLLAALR
jgi:hypothetical protein